MKDWSWFLIFWGGVGACNKATMRNYLKIHFCICWVSYSCQVKWEVHSDDDCWVPNSCRMICMTYGMSHVIESPMNTISNNCLHPSLVSYNMGVMTFTHKKFCKLAPKYKHIGVPTYTLLYFIHHHKTSFLGLKISAL
jgi:hypothetical protein